MNTIIIVGYPGSGRDHVEDLLLRCGMQPARPTRRGNMTPHEVVSTLCKATGAPDIRGPAHPDEVRQYSPAPVWNELVADLMLGNLDLGFWGWSDCQALPLLDYLRDLNPSITFVLVYQNPRSLLMEPGHDPDTQAEGNALPRILDRWAAYHSALLHFYLRNQDRCLLLHGDRVGSAMEECITLLGERLGRPLARPPGEPERTAPSEASGAEDALPGTCRPNVIRTGSNAEELIARDAESFMAEYFLMRHSRSVEVYDEMQATADLSHPQDAVITTGADAAWVAFQKQRWLCTRLLCALQQERESHALELERHRAYSRFCAEAQQLLTRELQHEQKGAWQKSSTLTGAPERIKSHLSYRLGHVLTQQSKSLAGLLGLPASLIAEIDGFRKQASATRQAELPPLHQYADADLAERVKLQLSYRLGSVMVHHAKSIFGWFCMPLCMLHEIVLFRKRRSPSGHNGC